MPNNKKDYGFGNNDFENDSFHPYNHIDDLINEKVEQHIRRVDNPHQVTLQQLGVDHLFTHNIRVEYDKENALVYLTLLDLYGNDIADLDPISINISEYSDKQIAEIEEYLNSRLATMDDKINNMEGNITQFRQELTAFEQWTKNYIDSLILDSLNSEV